jgi:hypothetical protein
MPGEEFRIKLTRRGEVYVDLRGLGEQRVRELRQMLEEIVGPVIEEIPLTDDGPGPAVRIVTDEGEERYQIRGGS